MDAGDREVQNPKSRIRNFRRRFSFALLGSIVLHLILSLLGWIVLVHLSNAALRSEPMVFRIQRSAPEPVSPETPRRLADAVAPTNAPVGPTDLIAEQNSRAQDPSDVIGTRPAPFFEKPAEVDHVAPPPSPAPPPPVAPPKAPVKEMPAKEPEKKPKKVPAKKPPPEPPVRKPDVAAAKPVEAPSMEEHAAAKDGAESGGEESGLLKIAKAGQNSPPALPSGDTRGRVEGGVLNKGFMGFEAMKDEIAPYLKLIQQRVEWNWRSALQLRYMGTMPTRAVVDCAISPEGKVLYARVVEPGDSATYAPLCREAIERSGPFPPFPFEVPDMYRSKDLEIRWTFSFLMSSE